MNTFEIDLFENNQQIDTIKAFVVPRAGEIIYLNDSNYKVKQITYRVAGEILDRIEADVEQQFDIAGSYKISSFTANPKVLGLYDDMLAVAPLILGTTCLNDLMISFESDGHVTADNPPSCQQSPVPTSSIIGIDASSKWILNGNTLTISKGDDTTITYTVIKTGAVLQLQRQDSQDIGLTGTKTVYTFTMDLARQ